MMCISLPSGLYPVLYPCDFGILKQVPWGVVRRVSLFPSSETQGQSVGSGEKAGRKVSSSGERYPGYRLSPSYFQKFKQMPAPDWAQEMLCIILPNR